jgi:hypothetical protein
MNYIKELFSCMMFLLGATTAGVIVVVGVIAIFDWVMFN